MAAHTLKLPESAETFANRRGDLVERGAGFGGFFCGEATVDDEAIIMSERLSGGP